MLRPASRYARQCSSTYFRPQRGLKRASQDATAAAGCPASSASSGRHGAPLALGYSQRVLLSSTSGRGGGEKGEEGDTTTVVQQDERKDDAADSKVRCVGAPGDSGDGS